jgi:hypothetical protein
MRDLEMIKIRSIKKNEKGKIQEIRIDQNPISLRKIVIEMIEIEDQVERNI